MLVRHKAATQESNFYRKKDQVMKKLYVITGRNGVGLVRSYSAVDRKRHYFSACNCKGYTLYSEAEEYALEHLCDMVSRPEYN